MKFFKYFITANLLLFLALQFGYSKGIPKTCHFLMENIIVGKVSSERKISNLEIQKRKAELDAHSLEYFDVIPWDKKDRLAVVRFFIDKLKLNFLQKQSLPEVDPHQKLGPISTDITDIRFLQINARNASADGKYSVIENAKQFKNGSLKAADLPPIRVFRDIDGLIWTLDHRRLAAMKLSGVLKKVKVNFVGEEVAKDSLFKYGSRNEGQSLFVTLEDGSSIVIVNKPLLKKIKDGE